MKKDIRIKINSSNPSSILLKLNYKGISVYNVKETKDGLEMIIHQDDLKKIKRLFLLYKVDYIEEIGLYRVKNNIKKHSLFLVGCIFAILIFFILSNIIVKIEVIDEDSTIRSIVLSALEEKGIKRLSFKKSYQEYEKIIEEIKDEYKDKIEWLEINVEGMILQVRIEKRIIKEEETTSSPCHIVANKSGVIMMISTKKGVSLVNIQDVVKKGDILISGDITLNDEVKKSTCASGEVYAEVWYQIKAELPLTEQISHDTGKMRYNFMIEKNNQKTVLLKSRIKNDKRVENKKLFNIFGYSFYLQKEYEVKKNTITYKEDEIIKKAISLIEDKVKLNNHEFEEIISEKVLQKEIKNNKLYIELFMAVKEQIGVKEFHT